MTSKDTPTQGAEDTENNKNSILEQAYDWRILKLDSNITPAQQRAFDTWINSDPRHAEAFERTQVMVSVFGDMREENINEEFRQPLLSERLKLWWWAFIDVKNGIPRLALFGGSLSIVAMALVFWVMVGTQQTVVSDSPIISKYESPLGEVTRVTLEDDSVVTLGASTSIEVKMFTDRRVVTLTSGNALFNVQTDETRPFSLSSGNLNVRVIGTVFELKHNGGVARIGVSEGHVKVSHPLIINGENTGVFASEDLRAGQQIAIQHQTLGGVTPIEIDNIGNWRDARLVYKEAPLSEVIADANRYSKIPIMINDPNNKLSELTISASFDGNNIDKTLELLPKILPITVDRTQKNQINIKFKPHK